MNRFRIRKFDNVLQTLKWLNKNWFASYYQLYRINLYNSSDYYISLNPMLHFTIKQKFVPTKFNTEKYAYARKSN